MSVFVLHKGHCFTMHLFLLQQEAEAFLTTHQAMKILWVLTQKRTFHEKFLTF